MTVNFTVTCSIRTRDFLTQNKRKPYQTLLNLQERAYFYLISYFPGNLFMDLVEGSSVTGKFESDVLRTAVQILNPIEHGD